MRIPRVYLGLLLVALAAPVSAQCWDCQVQYYPGDDCWMEGCWVTYDDGFYNNCGQQGECGSETCNTSGGICTPIQAALDGRVPGRLAPTPIDQATEGLLFWQSNGVEVVALQCSGAVVRADYEPRNIEAVRARTRRLALS